MPNYIYSVRYLLLRGESGKLLILRDVLPLLGVGLLCFSVVLLVDGFNFFGSEGFVDRFGALTSTLTGFYVAALVGAATFAGNHAKLDSEISVGPIHQRHMIEGKIVLDQLTRREYICSIFGYLSLLALTISIVSISLVTVASALDGSVLTFAEGKKYIQYFSIFVAILYALLIAHLALTTLQGLYYLSYRIYVGDGEPVPITNDELAAVSVEAEDA